jgi:hypothetical protein
MNVKAELKEGNVVAMTIQALTVKKTIVKQFPVKHILNNAEYEAMIPYGWVHGESVSHDFWDPMGIFEISGQLYLIRLNEMYWSKEFLARFNDKGQILVV